MTGYALDTSVVLQWYHETKELHIKEAKRILDDLRLGLIEIVIPDMLPLELQNALIKGKGLSIKEVNSILRDLFEMPIKIINVNMPILEITTEFMKKYNLASYDAYFLALAEYEGCKLISDDEKAHGKITDGSVLMLKDY